VTGDWGQIIFLYENIAFTKLVRYRVFYLRELGIGNWELGTVNKLGCTS
jgi:hypothetical protein